MSYRQLADREGHRWDVEDEGPLRDQERPDGEDVAHQLRFRRDDGAEEIRAAPHALDQMADVELRTLLDAGSVGEARKEPDTEANRTRGYGEVE